MKRLTCVDILTVDGVGISVWAEEIPEPDLAVTAELVSTLDKWLDILYPEAVIPSLDAAVTEAKRQLGDFCVKCAG